MIDFSKISKFVIVTGATDLRKGIDDLWLLYKNTINLIHLRNVCFYFVTDIMTN